MFSPFLFVRSHICIFAVKYMVRQVFGSDIEHLIRAVFGTDEDLYSNRWHGQEKTLDGIVRYTMSSLFDGVGNVEVFSYGDEYGFFAVDREIEVVRSFGIKTEHRDKKELFWKAVRSVLGDSFFICVWSDNVRAIRFFEKSGGVKIAEMDGGVAYKFNTI